jgi:hypothetical protein
LRRRLTPKFSAATDSGNVNDDDTVAASSDQFALYFLAAVGVERAAIATRY